MKYYNKDYANFIVNDEKERRLMAERDRRMNWRFDPKLKETYQKKLVKNGRIVELCWILMALCFFGLAAYNYSRSNAVTVIGILYCFVGICGVIASVLYQLEINKARSELAKIEAVA